MSRTIDPLSLENYTMQPEVFRAAVAARDPCGQESWWKFLRSRLRSHRAPARRDARTRTRPRALQTPLERRTNSGCRAYVRCEFAAVDRAGSSDRIVFA